MNLDNIINEYIGKFYKILNTKSGSFPIYKNHDMFIVKFGDEEFYFDKEPTDKEILLKIKEHEKNIKKSYKKSQEKYSKDIELKMKETMPTEKDWKNFEDLLKKHDWFSDYTDDYSVYKKGNESRNDIHYMYNWLKVWDLRKAEKLYKKYNKRG